MPAIRTHRDTTPEQKPYLVGTSAPTTPTKSPSTKSTPSTSPFSSATPGTPTSPSLTDAKPSLESPSAKPGRGTPGRAWTPAERLLLFDTAVSSGASIKGFEGLIPGRSGKACYDTWNTLLPTMRRLVADVPAKGKGKADA